MAVTALLLNAAIWGLIWYPYRLLERLGLGATAATMVTSFVAFCAGLAVIAMQRTRGPGHGETHPLFHPALLAIAAAMGFANVAFVWASVHGAVVQAVLLFNLQPVWTALFARLMLGERLTRQGLLALALGLAGTAVMLWNPQLGAPIPRNAAEWVALAAGASFGLSNVLSRRFRALRSAAKSLWALGGTAAIGVMPTLFDGSMSGEAGAAMAQGWWLLLLVGAALLSANLLLQYGIARRPANQVAMISLFELVVVAVASWLLAGERIGWREGGGGGLIAVCGLLSARASTDDAGENGASPAPGAAAKARIGA